MVVDHKQRNGKSLYGSFPREGIACFCHSHIRTFLFDGDTGVYMKVSAGWCVPPTSLVVASDDIVILADFPRGINSRYSKSNIKVGNDGLAFE